MGVSFAMAFNFLPKPASYPNCCESQTIKAALTEIFTSEVRASSGEYAGTRSSIIVKKTNICSLWALFADDVRQSLELDSVDISRHCETAAEKLVVKHSLRGVMFTEATSQIVQQINTVIATLCSLMVHGYIIFRIKSNYNVLNQYQNLLVAQSATYFFASIFRLLVNRKVTLDGEEFRGYSFIRVPATVDFIVLFILDLAEPSESIMLAVFNVHRVLLFVRPSLIKSFYFVTVPLAVTYVFCFACMDAFYPNCTRYFLLCFIFFISCVIITCYAILRRYFTQSQCSVRVRQMQNKLSNGMVIQIVIHICALGLIGLRRPFIALYGTIFGADEAARNYASGVYIVIAYLVIIWYPFMTGLLIRWSISGFLKRSALTGPSTLIADLTTPAKKAVADEKQI
ncbi:hypothetical protein Y032_0299g1790 [Ancylostoma ceylanicum]|uniref:G-protein coupled receptors family 1 profile domain-containing protein n=4 Tax=Ancylostoma ceylanicum TaxID=53326 RepID=A0A016S4X5_9BILA|nr:hypothetical protein Y032_0299g1790 [Ancylostoma ceylanicum]